MQELTVMGRIVAPYGVLGWVKVVPDTEVLDGLKAYKNWWIGKAPQWQEYQLKKLKIHNDVLVVKLDGVDDRDVAFSLKGKQIAVPKSELPETEPDEFYWADLIGLTVKNQQDVCFGKVADVMATGANDVLVVKPLKEEKLQGDLKAPIEERERLIPFIADVITQVDTAAQLLLVDWDQDY